MAAEFPLAGICRPLAGIMFNWPLFIKSIGQLGRLGKCNNLTLCGLIPDSLLLLRSAVCSYISIYLAYDGVAH